MNEKLDLDALERRVIELDLSAIEAYDYLRSLITRIRELERRVELGSMLLREQIDKTCAANLRVLELENAAAEIGRKKGEGNADQA